MINSFIFITVLFFIPCLVFSQQQQAYQVPDSYNFDYEVVQQVTSANKNSGSNKTITYHYAQNGGYAAMSTPEKENTYIIYTKDGIMVIVDGQKKTITVLRMKSMMGDLTKMAEQYKNSGSSSAPSTTNDNSNFKFAKTGNTKQINGYTSEEYGYTNNKGEKGSVWYAKVDFNTAMFSMFAAGASPAGPAMNKYAASATQDYPQLNDPHLLVTETENNAHPGEGLTTQSISKKALAISTKGYRITDLSSMMGR